MKERFVPTVSDIVSSARAITKPGAYSIIPEDNRVDTPVPGLNRTVTKVLCAPQLMGARFVHLELFVEQGGGTARQVNDGLEHFLYVLEGEISLRLKGDDSKLEAGGFGFVPPGVGFEFTNTSGHRARVLWFKKPYRKAEGIAPPEVLIDNEKNVSAYPDDTYTEKHLIPYDNNMSYDMCFNILIFEPGVYFGFVESHVMEHSLYMLSGCGLYWLNGDYHEVQKDDFVYMAPYCPQYFYATGWNEVRYLLYKDFNRGYDEDIPGTEERELNK